MSALPISNLTLYVTDYLIYDRDSIDLVIPPQRLGEVVSKVFQIIRTFDVNDTFPNFVVGFCDGRSLTSPMFSDNEMVIVGFKKYFLQFVYDGRARNQVVPKFW